MRNDGSKKIFGLAGILAAFYTGSQTKTDEKKMSKWLAEEGANRETADRILDSANFAKNEELLRRFPADEAWETAVPRLSATEKPTKSTRHSRRIIRYAASVALLLGIGGTWYLMDRAGMSDGQTSVSYPAGNAGAILTIEDGTIRKLSAEEDVPQKISYAGKDIVFDSHGADYSTGGEVMSAAAYHTIETRQKMEYSVVLGDGTKVFLNAESKLHFPVAFSGAVREVGLTGEAYFEVTKDRRPFVVRAGEADVTVLGTSFNMRAYEDENAIVTTLVEGRVAIACKGGSVEIGPGEQAIYTRSAERLSSERVDVSLYTSWRSGKFIFRNERLEDILATLSRWYGFEYEFADDDSREIRIGASLDRYDDMTPIINMLKATGLVNAVPVGGKLIISQTK